MLGDGGKIERSGEDGKRKGGGRGDFMGYRKNDGKVREGLNKEEGRRKYYEGWRKERKLWRGMKKEGRKKDCEERRREKELRRGMKKEERM